MTRSFLVIGFRAGQSRVLELAFRLCPLGYVYCVSPDFGEMEDLPSGVRAMRLTERRLPDIGALSAVHVFGSAEEVRRVRKHYGPVAVHDGAVPKRLAGPRPQGVLSPLRAEGQSAA